MEGVVSDLLRTTGELGHCLPTSSTSRDTPRVGTGYCANIGLQRDDFSVASVHYVFLGRSFLSPSRIR